MKLTIATLLLTLQLSAAAAPWTQRGGGAGNDSAALTRVDAQGNVYLAGYFYGAASFGGGTLTSAGATDLVLAKYSATGQHIWSRSYGGAGTEMVTGLALDASGNLFVCGYSVGNPNLGGATYTNAGQQDAWLAKYSPTGEHIWSQRFGGPMADQFTGLIVDRGGNVITCGWFQGTASWGGTNITTTFGAAPGVIVAKYAPDGRHLWSRSAQAGNGNYGYGIALGAGDAVFVGGSFFSWIDWGTGRLTSFNPTYQQTYLARLDASGNCAWSKRYGGSTGNAATALACDASGDVLAGGKFYQQTDLGGGPVLGGAVDQDAWVAKYSGADGSYRWGRGITGNNGIWVNSLASDAAGNALVGGYFYGRFAFGGTNTLTSKLSSYDGFVAKYAAASGDPLSAQSLGGNTTDGCTSVSASPAGTVASGFFTGTGTFGQDTFTSAGSYDGWVMSIPEAVTVPPTDLSVTATAPGGPFGPGDTVTITAMVTGPTPIAGATVWFTATSPTGAAQTSQATTASDGTARWLFTVPASDDGRWTGLVTATKDGFTPATSNFTFCTCACK